jgi:exonuclease III
VSTREEHSTTVNDDPEYDVFFTLPTDKYNSRGWGGKVYGVATIIRTDVLEERVSTVKEVPWDSEGRVSVVEMSSDKLIVFNIYAVNGTENPYKDSETGAVVGTRHDRKLQFHKLLLDECRSKEASGWNVVIIGDLNVAPARIDGHPNLRTFPEQHVRNRADFNRKFLDAKNSGGLKALDVWRHLRGAEKRYTYHPRGMPWGSSCDRVDLVLASRK